MGYDPFSPVTLALINVLCVPAGDITQTKFTTFLEWLRVNVSSINTELSNAQDAPSAESSSQDARVGKKRFPLLLNFGQLENDNILQNDTFFEPNRRAQLILGLIDGATLPSDDLEAIREALHGASSTLERYSIQCGGTKFSAKILVFDPPIPLSAEDSVVISLSQNSSESAAIVAWLSAAVGSIVSQSLPDVRPEEIFLPSLAARFNKLNGAGTRHDPRSEDVGRQSVASTNSGTSTTSQAPPRIAEDTAQSSSSIMAVPSALLTLQQGFWVHALDQFAEGARAARNSSQFAWHAKALEGLLVSMLLLAWVGEIFQVPQDCYPIGRGFSSSSAVHGVADANRAISEKFAGTSADCLQALTAMLPGLLATIMNLYDRAATAYVDGLPKLLACEARVRLAAMLVIVKRHGGVLKRSVLGELVGFRERPAWAQSLDPPVVPLLLRNSSLSNLLIESIIEAQAHLPVQSASVIYLAVCRCLSQLKLDRKQGFYLKDVLQRLPPVLVEARRISSANGQSLASSSDRQHDRVSQSVHSLLQLTTQVYGLPTILTPSQSTNLTELLDHAKRRLASWVSAHVSGDIATKLEVLRLCIRVSDALPDPVGSVKFMSLLLGLARQSITIAPGPSNALPLISSEEQARLISGIHNATNFANWKSPLQAFGEYWDDFLVRGVTVSEHPNAGKLMPHSSKDLSLTSSYESTKKNTFIYNPFSGSGSVNGPPVLVKDELASFEVVLQNPLEVELEVDKIALSAEGCAFSSSKHNIVLGPLCVQSFTLKGTPKETGTLRITGCRARVGGCREREFAIFSGKWKSPQIIKPKNTSSLDTIVRLPASEILETTVVSSLPSLAIKGTSLVQKSVMLLDGEQRRFTITLENSSDLDADLVLFSYEDSASQQLRDTLSGRDLQPADNYELHHQLATRPAIKRVRKQNGQSPEHATSTVNAKSEKMFEFTLLGKPGLTEAIILVDYAYIGKPRNEVEGTFFTRQLRFAVNVTVNGSIDINRCSILPIPPTVSPPKIQSQNGVLSSTPPENLASSPPLEYCLLQLDLRSIWQAAVRVTLEIQEDSSDSSQAPSTPLQDTTTQLTLLPGHVDRALILVPKVYIPDPFLPIPSLSTNRQFVVSASKLSLEAELASRETFWYRERLCSTLRIMWAEEHGSRKGDIDVRRGIRLNSRMLDALRVEHVQISFDLKPAHTDEQATIKRNDLADFSLRRDTFANLVVRVTNWAPDDLKLLVRLQPSLHNQPHNHAMDLGKKFVWSGVLQRVLRAPIKPGQSAEMDLGIVALVAGVYEVSATVEEIRARRRAVDVGGSGSGSGGGNGETVLPEIGEKIERRIWHARRPCLIRAVDELLVGE